jgi:hypothetical protein
MPTPEQYRLSRRNQATLKRVNELVDRASRTVVGRASEIADRQQMGGFLRSVVPGLIDRYGTVNAVAAREYYEAQRNAALGRTAPAVTRSGRRNQSRAADRVATARTQGQIYVARLPKFDAVRKAEPIIGYGMALFQTNGFDTMNDEVANALTRAVGSYNRDTLLYNSALDSSVVGVQRVAEPDACDFCQIIAFDSFGSVRVTDYAVEWHNNCRCSVETLYDGDAPYRPDYYDEFEYGEQTADSPPERFRREGWKDFSKQFRASNYVSA